MRLLHVIGSVDPIDGGPIEGVLRGAEALQAMGHECEILSLDPTGSPVAAACHITTHAVGPAVDAERWRQRYLSLHRYRYSSQMGSWLRRHAGDYDAVIVNGVWNYTSLGAWRALKDSPTPYFIFTHGMLDPWFGRAYPIKTFLKRLWWRLLEHRVLRDAACVLYTVESERQLAHQAYEPFRCRERVIGYGTAPPPPRSDAAIQTFRRSLPGLGDKPYLLFLSRIDPKKGCDILIQAFAPVAAAYPSLQLVMAGPDQVGWRKELERLAQAHGTENRIHWPGMLTGDAKWGAYYGSQAFVLASHSENFGVVVAEALACAKPVLITDKVAIAPQVEEDGAALVSLDAVGPFTAILERFLALGDAERQRMSERALRSFQTRFHIEVATRRLVGAVEEFRDKKAKQPRPSVI